MKTSRSKVRRLGKNRPIQFSGWVLMVVCAQIFLLNSAHAVGSCDVDSAELSSEEYSELLFMIEEEQVAGDLYSAFSSLHSTQIFSNIESSERSHESALRQVLAAKYPSVEVGTGEEGSFENSQLQALYDQLIAQGRGDLIAALEVGALVEEVDIRDLRKAIRATNDAGLVCVYRRLLRGSKRHLSAFVRQLKRQGVRYKAQVLTMRRVRLIVRNNARPRNGKGRKTSW